MHGEAPVQLRFNFSELDSMAADLHLMIEASKIFDISVRQIPAKVSGPIETRFESSRKGFTMNLSAVRSGRFR